MIRSAFLMISTLAIGCGPSVDRTERTLDEARRLGLAHCVDEHSACSDSPMDCLTELEICIIMGQAETRAALPNAARSPGWRVRCNGWRVSGLPASARRMGSG